MNVGVPTEIKSEEYRVGLTPESARELIVHGHRVMIQSGAGASIGFTDSIYLNNGVEIGKDAQAVYAFADMIVKVKEPQEAEYALLREGQILFTYLHLAPNLKQAHALIKAGCIAIAYETVTSSQGLPLLMPMSQVAGRLAIQAGAHCLEKPSGGAGLLLGGVPGVYPAKVVVIGGGVVGSNAVRMAMGKEAMVTVLDRSLQRLQALDLQFGGRLNTVFATQASIEEYIVEADLVIGAVLIPGQSAPHLVKKDILKQMRPGSVVVDVAIDQGGCIETSYPTTHANPTFKVCDVVHYCVSNMPGAVPRTSTLALNNATLPFVIALADQGYRKAMREDIHLRRGLNIHKGHITHEGIALDLGIPYTPAEEFVM